MDEPTYHLSAVVKNSADIREDFSGPLDVILLLLSKNKIEIRDIQISLILDQYLQYLEEMKQMDLEITSEFITMASRLILIKTKMLLSETERQEGLSEMELLIQSLEQRQRQEIMEKLQPVIQTMDGMSDAGRGLYTRQPEPRKTVKGYRYRHDPADLVKAIYGLSERDGVPAQSPERAFRNIVGREPFPVELKAAQVIRQLFALRRTVMKRLFRGNRSRSEIVATFLSILELCRLRSVQVGETESGEVEIVYVRMPEEGVETTDDN